MGFREILGSTNRNRKPDAPLDDSAMIHYARSLAVSLSPNGQARVSAKGCMPAELRRIGAQAQQTIVGGVGQSAAMEWLTDNVRLVETTAAGAQSARQSLLPAIDELPRVQILMKELVGHGDALVSIERLKQVVRAFDEVQGLLMEEIWLIPLALRVELCTAFADVSRRVLAAQRERNAAEAWVQSGADTAYIRKSSHSSAFYERALQLMHEQEMPKARRMLEEWLEERVAPADNVIVLEHELQAIDRLWMSNIMATLRMLDELNGPELFGELSRAEMELTNDPSGIYPLMDDASRAAVREQVRLIARATGASEMTVARYAARAAEQERGSVRGGICYWLYDDDGRAALAQSIDSRAARLPQITPDPKGTAYILIICFVTAILWGVFAAWLKNPLLSIVSIPAVWSVVSSVVNAVVTRVTRPRQLLKLEIEEVPEKMRTMVAIPALISSPSRGAELLEQLEALGCLERDENIDYLLLGDFKDGPNEEENEDEEILRVVRTKLAEINARSERKKYYYLHRRRAYAPGSDSWMGHERKRGALMALNELLLNGENAFDAEGGDGAYLAKRYAFVVTLDADTRMLPGTVKKLIGTMSHPLNVRRIENGVAKGYSVLAPRMELPASAVTSGFIRLMGGHGGVDSYPTTVSDVYQDLTGQGIFGGKGIYDLKAFHEALEDTIPDNAIVSHDLIEGILAGAGFLGDITMYDGFPKSLGAFLKRLERWTRGDWQLLPFIGGRVNVTPLGRYMMIANLIRSLALPASLALLILSMWFASPGALVLGLLCPFMPALITLPHRDTDAWKRAILNLSILPVMSAYLLSAVGRTLKRLRTKRNMLQWTTAADAEREGTGHLDLPGRLCAILLAPALLRPEWILPAVGFAALFWVGAPLVRALEKPDEKEKLTGRQIAMLTDLARQTWHFFQAFVPLESGGLPPDNVQIDPPVGAARRTSPTNIGLYLVSCLSAAELRLIGAEELLERVRRTIDTLHRLEKWNGQLYNWYDTETLLPLKPRYVSSVDGGNLAACLMVVAEAMRTTYSEPALAGEIDALTNAMDFGLLYNEKRNLFVIGADVENNRVAASHYDLLASESRILSFVAMMQNIVPIKHWSRMGRSVVRAGTGQALLSWSGTMFEYLMPDLFMRAPKGSLLERTNHAIVEAQREHARGARQLPWGVSESGYSAFDMQMNYQYRAFGLSALSLRGGQDGKVIAPYAGILALPVDAEAACDNLESMLRLGWQGEYGLYEAIDYDPKRSADGAPYQIVYSHMAHHQGMILAAICNALCDDVLVKLFTRKPQARAINLLLEEKPATRVALNKRGIVQPPQRDEAVNLRRTSRTAHGDALLPDAQLMYGGGGTLFATAGGASFFRVNGTMANRWRGDPALAPDGLFVHIHLPKARRAFTASGQRLAPDWLKQRATFDVGQAVWVSRTDELEVKLTVCVSPEDGALVQRVKLINHTDQPLDAEVTGCFAVALAAQTDMEAHPAFQNLFIESALAAENALVFTRRSRDEETHPVLLHAVTGARQTQITWETDMARLIGREGEISRADGIAGELSGTLGAVINPCSALRVGLTLPAGAAREVAYTIAIVGAYEMEEILSRHATPDSARRAQQLSITQAHAMLDFLGISGAKYQLVQRATAFLMYPRLPFAARGEAAVHCSLAVSGLWALGISGDLPVITAFVSSKEQLDMVRDAMRAHEFYRMMGVWCDLVLVNEYGNDYDQPIRDALRELVSASHLRDLIGDAGGVFILEGTSLTSAQRTLIRAVSAILLDDNGGAMPTQLRRQLESGERYQKPLLRPMENSGALAPIERLQDNGYGGFSPDGLSYIIDLKPGRPTPAPWSNLLANEEFGSIVTERGGGFTWDRNSRMSRLTPFDNNPLREGWGELAYVVDPDSGQFAPLMPGPDRLKTSFRVTHQPGMTRFESSGGSLRWELQQFADAEWPVKCLRLTLTNEQPRHRAVQLTLFVDWLMGVDHAGARMTHIYEEDGICFARGSMEGVGFACVPGQTARIYTARRRFLGAEGLNHPAGLARENSASALAGDGCGVLLVPIELEPGGEIQLDMLIGWGQSPRDGHMLAAEWARGGASGARLSLTLDTWERRLSQIALHTADPVLNAMVSRWLPYQTLAGRVMGRAGLYQAGGAYGFRDQLQDMLSLISIDPRRVRAHILLCAAHQFEDGDVQHWWHPERMGVRTHISDDLLFLPYVTAYYVEETGDQSILAEQAPFLSNVEIPDGREDWYGTPGVSAESGTLHEHCLRAFRRACRLGAHGLPLMGSGDWNDGMNRVGGKGLGESVWLAEFLSFTARKYAELCTIEEEKAELMSIADAMVEAVESTAWDGEWYLRAYMDNGAPIGSAATGEHGCRIDAIAQSWAVIAGLNRQRAEQAMDAVWDQLVDREHKLIKLLTPPFDSEEVNPGYIRGYVPGVRENGGQYTHAACWVVMAYAVLGQAERAWEAYEMLLPPNHARTREEAERYKVEPYVVAADVYGEQPHEGRGGWTWYTGAASWMVRVALRYLMGYRRTGNTATLNALLPAKWDEASMRVRVGESLYTLTARRGVETVMLDGIGQNSSSIELIDDGKEHEAVFPVREK